MAVITLSGQTGSGGRTFGPELARLLGADYVDRELLAEAARRTGIGIEAWEERDMHPASLAERVARLLQTFLEKSAASYPGDSYVGGFGGEPLLSRTYEEMARSSATQEEKLDDQRFLEVTTAIILDLAKMDNVVIVGRGAPYILKDHPSAFHVLTVAPLARRVEVFMEREDLSRQEAERLVEVEERHRCEFVRKFFHADPLAPMAFDLVLNTAHLTWAACAKIVAEGARLKASATGLGG